MSVLVFDIETVPDTKSGAQIYGLESLPEEDIARAMEHIQCQKTGTEFLSLHLHQVVAISIVFWNEKTLKVLSLGDLPVNEAKLVKLFYTSIEKHKPQIVSWNGGGFDLPVLHYRAMLHHISAPSYWESGDRDQSFRYDNYISRYHWRHLDLMDKLAHYNSRAYAPLDQMAKMLGLPGKQGVGGENVAQAWRDGKINEIRNYCEVDAMNTYLIYLRFQLMRGRLDRNQYCARIDQVHETLVTSDQEHWLEFLETWEDTPQLSPKLVASPSVAGKSASTVQDH